MADDSGKEGDAKRDFAGKYDHVKSEGLEDFMRENGANLIIRKMASWMSPGLEITQDGEAFIIKLLSTFMPKETSFTVGTDYEEKQHSGDIMMVSPVWEGDALVLSFTPKEEGKGKAQKHTRTLNGEELTLVLEVGDVKATRIYKRLPAPPAPQ